MPTPTFHYYTVQSSGRSGAGAGRFNHRVSRYNAIGDLVHSGAFALHKGAAKWRIKHELRKIEPKILAELQRLDRLAGKTDPNHGVLVKVAIFESAQPDPTGMKFYLPQVASIVQSGNDFKQVLNRYKRRPKLELGAGPGYVNKDLYIWITR